MTHRPAALLVRAIMFGAVLAIAVPSVALAQEGSVVLGFSRPSTTYTGSATHSTSSSGFLVGGEVASASDRPVGIAIEGLFVMNGIDTPDQLALRLAYLEAAALPRFNLQTSRDVRIHGYVGPQVGFRLHTSGAPETLTTSTADDISREDLSVVVGGGFDWRGRVVDVRYTRGVNTITSAALFGPAVTAKTNTIAVVFSFRVK
jgi:hypothetical protein